MAFRTGISRRMMIRSGFGLRSMSSWWGSVEPAAKDPILGVTEAFLADPSPDKVNVGVVSSLCLPLWISIAFCVFSFPEERVWGFCQPLLFLCLVFFFLCYGNGGKRRDSLEILSLFIVVLGFRRDGGFRLRQVVVLISFGLSKELLLLSLRLWKTKFFFSLIFPRGREGE